MSKYGKESRIQRAQERQKDRDKRSNKDQLAVLDKRLGEGLGAKKERERLIAVKVKEASKKENKITKKSKKVKS